MHILNQEVPLWMVLAYMGYAAVVQALPRPDDCSNKFYIFIYQFAHGMALNIALAMDPKKKAFETPECVQNEKFQQPLPATTPNPLFKLKE